MLNAFARTSLILLATLGAFAGCGGGQISYPHETEPDPIKSQSEFVIGVADRLRIEVREDPALSGEHTVRPDGVITIPLVGDLKAAGRKPSELNKVLTERLTQFLSRTATVRVAVVEVNSYRFTVSGEVVAQGVFSRKHYVRIVEAIMLAGGFTRFADKSKITVVRCCNKDGSRRKIPIDYNAILGGNTVMNIVLLPGDEVYVK